MERLAAAMLERPDLLAKYGDRVFWCGWTALKRTRATGVPQTEVVALGRHVEALSRRGPETLRSSLTARLIRLLGLRIALALK